MFETDALPPTWVDRLNSVDEVWVPSAFNLETFQRAGVRVPIHVVPGGVDSRLFRPGIAPLGIPGASGRIFLSIFEWSHRKAPDVLLRAWADAFTPADSVTLVLRCFPRAHFEGDTTEAVNVLIDKELASIGRARSDVAPIVVIGAPLPPVTMPRLMAAADVFLGVSRGEGWGRPLLEAMASGLAVVATRWSGNLEFMNDENSLLVEVSHLSEIDDRMDIPFYRGQRWAEPSVDHLSRVLRALAQDDGLVQRIGARARSDAEERWQWSSAGAIADARLQALVHRSSTPLRVAAPSPSIEVCWKGDLYADTGFATANREVCVRLAKDPRFLVVPETTEKGTAPPDTADEIAPFHRPTPARTPDTVIEVRHAWPPDLQPATAGPLVVAQPWEYGGIPEAWVDGLRSAASEVWVPSKWVRECFIRSGVPAEKVVVVPYGVDTDVFRPDGPTLDLRTTAQVRLLFVGGTIPRKGFDALLDAYLESFGPEDDVCLVVKPFGADSYYRHMAMDDRVRALAEDPGAPAVEMVDGRLTKLQMAALYRTCDVLVHPYRGEGFGLTVAEAMACGLPVVVTAYGACLDFCDERTGWMIPATTVPISIPAIGPSRIGYWTAEPDASALRSALREAVADASARVQRGEAARSRIANNFTWDHSAAIVRDRLLTLQSLAGKDRPPADPPQPASTEWHALTRRVDEFHQLTASALDALLKTQQSATSQANKALGYMGHRIALLEREASTLPGGSTPIPQELLYEDETGRAVLGFQAGAIAEAGYRDFEDLFRGTEELIRERQRYYLPYLRERAPVLDIGCGRGEMLDLLREAGVPSSGVDLDQTMVDRALAKGLDVSRGDALRRLRDVPDGGLGAIFSAQVIEHLDAADLDLLLIEARRVLRPTGVLIVETVNPHCAIARKNFWLDLTHKHQIFPEVAIALCRRMGFREAKVVFPGGSGTLQHELLDMPDYAVIALV